MRVLVACEKSHRVAGAFRELGHDAWSCDILPCEIDTPYHIQDDVLKHLNDGWDLMIAHPPCTYLSYAATKFWNDEGREKLRLKAFGFFMQFVNAPIKHICIENPMGYPQVAYRKCDQIIQPYYFGEPESKRTCLWLKNLPPLRYTTQIALGEQSPIVMDTKIVKPKIYGYYKRGKKKGCPIYGNNYLKFSEDRAEIRSRTFEGIAMSMATQWGNIQSNFS